MLYKFQIFFKICFITDIFFPTFCETLYVGISKLLLKRRSFSWTLCLVRRRPQNWVPVGHPSGSGKDGSRTVLNEVSEEHKGEQSIPSFQLHVLCTDWCAARRCHAGGRRRSSSGLAELFQFAVLTSVMFAHIALNWLWHLCWRISLKNSFTFLEDASRLYSQTSTTWICSPSSSLQSDLADSVREELHRFSKEIYAAGILRLRHSWKKCVDIEEDFV
jgi:hypothetical protein